MGCVNSSTVPSLKSARPIPPLNPPYFLQTLYAPIEESNELRAFHIATNSITTVDLSLSPVAVKTGKLFVSYCRIANLKQVLYVCGGKERATGNHRRKNIQVVTAAQSFIVSERAEMAQDKCSMGLAVINDSFFIVAGGQNDAIVSLVEMYNVSNNTWERKGSLTIPRSGAAICIFAEHYAYVLGGCQLLQGGIGPERSCTVIERCDLTKLVAVWKIVPIYLNNWPGATECACFQRSVHEILIVGGCTDDGKSVQGVEKTYIFNVVWGAITAESALPSNDVFIAGFYYTSRSFAFGFGVSGTVYSHDFTSKRWASFPSETPLNSGTQPSVEVQCIKTTSQQSHPLLAPNP